VRGTAESASRNRRRRQRQRESAAAGGAFATIESMMREVNELSAEVRRFLEFLRAA